jgi:hypothetical protein
MKWTVTYRPSARDELATIWMDATDRNAVSVAAEELEAHLKNDPLRAGESRGGKRRLLIEPPLALDYEADFDDMLVTVIRVLKWN